MACVESGGGAERFDLSDSEDVGGVETRAAGEAALLGVESNASGEIASVFSLPWHALPAEAVKAARAATGGTGEAEVLEAFELLDSDSSCGDASAMGEVTSLYTMPWDALPEAALEATRAAAQGEMALRGGGGRANSIAEDLLKAVQSARQSKVRCIKASVQRDNFHSVGAGGVLVPTAIIQEDAGSLLKHEFERTMRLAIQADPGEDGPGLILFRADARENIEGSRWLLVVWLPAHCSLASRAVTMRSRGLLTTAVSQPYFLQETFVDTAEDLRWDLVQQSHTKGPLGRRADLALLDPTTGGGGSKMTLKELLKKADDLGLSLPVDDEEDKDTALEELCTIYRDQKGFIGAAEFRRLKRDARTAVKPYPIPPVQAPLAQSESLAKNLHALARQEESCIRLVLAGGATNAISPLVLESVAVRDVHGVVRLAEEAATLRVCSYFLLMHRGCLFFVFWCPESAGGKSSLRLREDACYAVMKASVLRVVLQGFPDPPRGVLQVDAHEAQAILDAAGAVGAGSRSASFGSLMNRDGPSDVAPNVPCIMEIPERLYPPWLGGSKASTIGFVGGGGGAAVRQGALNGGRL